jgi:hypothetical protein
VVCYHSEEATGFLLGDVQQQGHRKVEFAVQIIGVHEEEVNALVTFAANVSSPSVLVIDLLGMSPGQVVTHLTLIR